MRTRSYDHVNMVRGANKFTHHFLVQRGRAIARLIALALLGSAAGLQGCAHERSAMVQSAPPSISATKDAEGRPLAVIACENPRTKKTGYGPPPYEYWRIVGGTVPDAAIPLAGSMDIPGLMHWTFLGPRPITSEYWSGNANAGGRIASIACHPTNSAIAYAASASGGIWKTTDSGVTWTPMSDHIPNLNHGAVALDKNFPNTVYAGTGEYTSGSAGDGLYRSLDEGQTWTKLAGTSSLGTRCSGLAVVSGASATTPATIHWVGSSGYRRSTNGGTTWTNGGLSGSASSIAIDSTNALNVYVALHGIGIRKSINGGQSFTSAMAGLPSSGMYRIVLAISKSSPSVLYAALINSSGGLLGFYTTTNGGGQWTQLAQTPNFPTPQGSWDVSVGVDPSNSTHVYCGGVSPIFATAGVIETSNGGSSWTEISGTGGQIHPDQQCIAFAADGTPWFGCDGGVWRRVGSTWVNCNASLAAIQNYTIAQHPTDPNRFMAGTQDNGSAGTTTGAIAWAQTVTGDGGYGSYKADSYTTLFATYVYLKVYRFVNSASTDITGPWITDPRDFIAPLIADPNSPNTLLGGTNRLWRTTNASGTPAWAAISLTTVANGGTITAIAGVKGVAGTIWVGNSEGGVWRTTDSGTTWTQVRAPDTYMVTAISTKPSSSTTAFISVERSTGTRVARTMDASAWTDVTGTLPAGVTAQTIAVDWGRPVPTIYLGSQAGIYASTTTGATWVRDGDEFPSVNIGQLEIDPVRRTVIVGTYGRGAWRSAMPPAADINADGLVDATDLTAIFAAWGTCPASQPCPADVDMSGLVDALDLAAVLSAFPAQP